jgi:hypothetical protein
MVCPDWPEIDELMSNCDHEVNQEVAQRLKADGVIARYSAWNFNALCWFCDGQFHAAVSVFHDHVATISADTPEDLMRDVSKQFGWD